MQIFDRSILLWGLKVITRSNFGSLIQQNSVFSPHKGMDLAKICISKMVYWQTNRLIESLIDFVSNVLEISKSCMCLEYVMSGAELQYHVSADFVREFHQFLTTDLRLVEQIKYLKAV